MSDVVQASISIVSIQVDGTSNPEAERDLEEIVVDTSQNLPSMATIRMHDPRMKWSEHTFFGIGKEIKLTMAPPRSLIKAPASVVFLGEIISMEPSFSALGTSSLTIRAYDHSHRLHNGTKTRSFIKMTDSDIVKKIAREAGIKAGTVTSKANKYEYLVQNNITDFEFLSVRARRSGCILSVVNNTINFARPDELLEDGPEFEMGESLREFSVRASGAQQGNKITAIGWDFRTKKEITSYDSTPKEKWSETGLPLTGYEAGKMFGKSERFLTTFAPQTQAEADEIVLAALNDQQGYYVEADGISYGHPQLVAGKTISLKGLGKYTGKYYVTSATHIYNSAGYEIHFTVAGRYQQNFNQLLNPAQGGEKEPGAVYNVVVALVTNNSDPENMGRVKVKFPWLSATVESNWARVASTGAGKGRGFFWVPEVNDEVLVAFEHGNMNCPYVIGSLWNGKDNPPVGNKVAVKSGLVNQRIVQSRSGHIIKLDDEAGKESITIIDKTGRQSIFIDSTLNNIDIKADGNLTIDVKGYIDIKAVKDIRVTAQGNINMAGMTVAIDAKVDFKVDAKTSAMMKGGVSLMLDSKAINISATGPATVAGKPIMLN